MNRGERDTKGCQPECASDRIPLPCFYYCFSNALSRSLRDIIPSGKAIVLTSEALRLRVNDLTWSSIGVINPADEESDDE